MVRELRIAGHKYRRLVKWLWLLWAGLAICNIAVAQSFDIGGTAYIDYYGGIDPTTFYTHERIRISISPEISARLYSWLYFHASGVFFVQPIGQPLLIDPVDSIREVYLGLRASSVDMYLGFKYVNWGKVDVMSPLNVINHTDTSVLSMDNFFEASLSDLLFQARVFLSDSVDIDVVYVPFFQPDHYAIDEISIQNELVLEYPGIETRKFSVDAAFVNTDIPLLSEWGHSIHAAVNYTSGLLDGMIVYSYYRDHFLDFDLSNIVEEIVHDGTAWNHTITGVATPEYHWIHNIGLGLSFYLWDFLINTDASVKLTPDLDGTDISVRNPEIFWAVQIERLLTVVNTQVRLQLNTFYRQILNAGAQTRSDFSDVLTAFLYAVIDDYAMQKPSSQVYVLARFDTSFFHEKLLVAGNFIYGYTEHIYSVVPAFYVSPRIAYKLNDYFRISTGADIWWGGSHEGFLGRDAEKDNYFVRLQVYL